MVCLPLGFSFSLLILGTRSYAVPKEVGKIGTNDPSFIQPVSQRKDGIAAMFNRQNATAKPNPENIQEDAKPLVIDVKKDDDIIEISPPPETFSAKASKKKADVCVVISLSKGSG